MIKGCERRMIKIENPESELFESAYFILRQNVPSPKRTKRDELLREAVRITDGRFAESKKRRRIRERLIPVCAFFAGALLASAVLCVIVF